MKHIAVVGTEADWNHWVRQKIMPRYDDLYFERIRGVVWNRAVKYIHINEPEGARGVEWDGIITLAHANHETVYEVQHILSRHKKES